MLKHAAVIAALSLLIGACATAENNDRTQFDATITLVPGDIIGGQTVAKVLAVVDASAKDQGVRSSNPGGLDNEFYADVTGDGYYAAVGGAMIAHGPWAGKSNRQFGRTSASLSGSQVVTVYRSSRFIRFENTDGQRFVVVDSFGWNRDAVLPLIKA